jgi:uncharacterized membrane protein
MNQTQALITSPSGILAVLAGVCAFYFLLESKTKWKIFTFFPPLIFIYLTPVILSNTGVIPFKSDVYGFMSSILLPMFLTLMLLNLDIMCTSKVLGKGIFVMLFGTLGVIVGAPLAYMLLVGKIGPDAWKTFGTLAGSWIGGTGNMAATAEGLKATGAQYGLATIADNLVNIIWIPALLASKSLKHVFNRFTKVSQEKIDDINDQCENLKKEEKAVHMTHILYLLAIGFAVTFISMKIAPILPQLPPVLTASTWKVLLITTFAISLSFTPAKKVPGSHAIAMALVYMFVANMGARAQISSLMGAQAVWFLIAAYIWIIIHGCFCLLGAKLFKVDIHMAAISSAANVGGAASLLL